MVDPEHSGKVYLSAKLEMLLYPFGRKQNEVTWQRDKTATPVIPVVSNLGIRVYLKKVLI